MQYQLSIINYQLTAPYAEEEYGIRLYTTADAIGDNKKKQNNHPPRASIYIEQYHCSNNINQIN